jgi:C-terminal processing protease CtpA/Prc
VFYPERRPTQQVGIVPDVVVEPTIEAVRAGRDPVLEEALRLIFGPKTPISSIYKMYRARSYGSHFSPSLGAFSER